MAWLARGLYYVLPNLAPFDVKAQVVHAPADHAGLHRADHRLRRASTSRALLTLAALFFSRRDFK